MRPFVVVFFAVAVDEGKYGGRRKQNTKKGLGARAKLSTQQQNAVQTPNKSIKSFSQDPI